VVHSCRFATSIIVETGYGHEVKDHNDRFVHLAREAMDDFEICLVAGAFLVDSLPWRELSGINEDTMLY
jgi:hypothetical protein